MFVTLQCRSIRIFPLFLLVFVGLPVSCGDGAKQEPLIYARGSDSDKLDPHDVSDGESVKVIDQIYETLVAFPEDPEADLKPQLATDWSSSDNGKTWTFQLRKGVQFHDGSTLTAEDVVFSFERLMNPASHGIAGPYSTFYSNVKSVVAVDRNTVRFELKTPSAVFLRNLAMFSASVVNPSVVKNDEVSLASQPSGTGPFTFHSWSRGERIVLKRNESYWGDPPSSKTVVFIPVRENSQRTQKLISGGAHIIDGLGLENLDRIRSSPDTELLKKPGMNMAYLAMNTMHSPFDKPDVRRALAYGINRKKLLKEIYRGVAEPADTPLPPTIWGHHDGLDRYTFQPNRAKRILKQADVNLDRDITFLHMTNPRPYMPDPPLLARTIKNNLEQIGFTNVTLRQMDWMSYLQAIQNGEHDLCLLGWTTDNGDPDNFLSALFHSKNAVKGSANNVSFFRNDTYNRTVEQAKRTLARKKRTALYADAQEILHEQVPVLPLAYMPVLAAKRTDVVGYEVYSIGEVRLNKARHKQPSGAALNTGTGE